MDTPSSSSIPTTNPSSERIWDMKLMKENLEKIEHTNTFTLEDEIRKAIKIENEIIKVIKMLETGIPTDETLSVNNEIVTTTTSSTTQNLPILLGITKETRKTGKKNKLTKRKKKSHFTICSTSFFNKISQCKRCRCRFGPGRFLSEQALQVIWE